MRKRNKPRCPICARTQWHHQVCSECASVTRNLRAVHQSERQEPRTYTRMKNKRIEQMLSNVAQGLYLYEGLSDACT